MYRILIADDEGIMVESLKGILLKNYPDRCEIETAKTGRAAIEQAEYFHPDIIFMDIQMPGINGIQAMTEIRSFNQTALFYVISAYDKFDYAAEAIALGVERYLTKPVNRRTVLDVMEEAMEKVDQMRRKRSDQLKVQEKLETVVPLVENGFVSSIVMPGELQDADYYRQLLDITQQYAFICIFRLGQSVKEEKPSEPMGISIRPKDFYPQFRAIVKSYMHCMIGFSTSSRIAAVVPFERPEIKYEERIQIIEQVRQIANRLEERLQIHFRVGIGGVHSMSELRFSYQEAARALQESGSRIIHSNDIGSRGAYEGDFPAEVERAIFECLKKGDLEGMRSQAGVFFDWMIHRYPSSRDNIRLKVLEYIIWAEREAFREGAVNYGFESRDNYLTQVLAIEDYEHLRVWFFEKMNAACSAIRDRREKQSETAVTKAKNYIQEHYGFDISLDDVSREVNISPYYFSKLFKEESGENFIEYLTRTRIEKAKELLREGNLSIKEISSLVGYADPNYFSRLFKKQTEMTPREYRERNNV